ncbi:MAG: hypothetical protein IT330_19130, partial [Anaerolineae bacterium]|nr:hypothetical protein [Anaerolineae bacterium]
DLPLVKEIRRRVEEQCHIPAHNLMVGCTHTHRAPSIFGAQNTIPYAAFVVEAVVQAVCEAVGRLQPVRVGVNKVETKDLVINRRMKMIDGRVYSSRYSVPSTWYVPPEILQGTGPVDPWLTSLRFENLEGEVVGLLGNFTGHPLAAFRSRYISGDSFGHAEELLETVHEGAVAMLTNGAEGNTIVRGPFPERGPRYDPQAEIVGQIVGGYWLTAQAGALPVDGGSVAAAWREVEMPVRESFLERMRNSPPEVQRRNAEVVRQGKMVSEMQVLRINDIALVAMPGEVFVEVQLMLKEKSPFPHTVVVGCANDVLGYVPTREAFSEGGYEVDETGEWNRPTEDTLGMLGMTALDLIRGLWRDYQEKNAHE